MRSLGSGWAARPVCGNQPDSYGRMKECPWGTVCRNYRARPAVPRGKGVKMIPLGGGLYAYVDAADYEWLNQWHWRMSGTGYAQRREKNKYIFMHREIMKPPKGKVVDHINGSRVDNTRANMRNITRRQNTQNKGKHVGAVSIYKGVTRDRRTGKWYVELHSGAIRRRSGPFEDEVEAARTYDRMAIEVYGEFARLNFPEEWLAKRRRQVHARWLREQAKQKGKAVRRGRGSKADGQGKQTRRRGRTAGRRGRRKAAAKADRVIKRLSRGTVARVRRQRPARTAGARARPTSP